MNNADGVAKDVSAALKFYADAAAQRLREFFDVETAVADALQRRDVARAALDERTRELTAFKISSTEAQSAAVASTAHFRARNERDAAAWIDAIDDISLARHHFQTVLDAVGEQHAGLADAVGRETSSFGYVGKKLISSSIAYEVLRERLRSHEPFERELRAFREEIDGAPDFTAMADGLQHAAPRGLAPDAWIAMAARNVSAAMAEAAATQTAHITSSWFSRIKFTSTNSAAPASPTPPPHPSSIAAATGATSRELDTMFLAHVARREYGEALEAMEMAMERANVKDISAGEALREHVEVFRGQASDRVAADHFLRYCDAALLCARFHFIEGVLSV